MTGETGPSTLISKVSGSGVISTGGLSRSGNRASIPSPLRMAGRGRNGHQARTRGIMTLRMRADTLAGRTCRGSRPAVDTAAAADKAAREKHAGDSIRERI